MLCDFKHCRKARMSYTLNSSIFDCGARFPRRSDTYSCSSVWDSSDMLAAWEGVIKQ